MNLGGARKLPEPTKPPTLEQIRSRVINTDQEQRTKKHLEICTGLNGLYDLKNKKYGNSFSKTFEEYGPAMLCIRLDDKLQRAKQLLLKGEEGTDDESVIDTLRDLANYAIMGIMELERGKEDEIQ